MQYQHINDEDKIISEAQYRTLPATEKINYEPMLDDSDDAGILLGFVAGGIAASTLFGNEGVGDDSISPTADLSGFGEFGGGDFGGGGAGDDF
jgi:hypothetical protein